MQFHGLNADDARAFAEKWLPAWTGNRPELLASFYTLDAVYSDPAIPKGVRRVLLAAQLASRAEAAFRRSGGDVGRSGPASLASSSIPSASSCGRAAEVGVQCRRPKRVARSPPLHVCQRLIGQLAWVAHATTEVCRLTSRCS